MNKVQYMHKPSLWFKIGLYGVKITIILFLCDVYHKTIFA